MSIELGRYRWSHLNQRWEVLHTWEWEIEVLEDVHGGQVCWVREMCERWKWVSGQGWKMVAEPVEGSWWWPTYRGKVWLWWGDSWWWQHENVLQQPNDPWINWWVKWDGDGDGFGNRWRWLWQNWKSGGGRLKLSILGRANKASSSI